MSSNTSSRGAWGSTFGFVMAASGSAIGLGNIWKFPIETAQHGGGAFVLVYLICVFAIGIPVMIAELAVGRKTGLNPVGAFKKLAPKSLWKVIGGLGVLTGLMILSAYAVVAGWILKYIWYSISGAFNGLEAAQIQGIYDSHIADGFQGVLLHLVFIAITAIVVAGGVQGGIEKASKILMPCLLVLLLLLVVRSVTLPGAGAGLAFYLNPDLSKIDFTVIMNALGQAFFSLSLGMGAMITYGSYISKRDNLVSNAGWVCLMDSGLAILAGFVIFPALFAVGLNTEQAGGPGLLFVVLPSIFNALPWGQFFGSLFFILVAIAALTSTISLLEVVVAYFIDEKGWSRKKAAWLIGGVAFLVGLPSVLSHGAVSFLSGFMWQVFQWFGDFSLIVGALALCIFVVYRLGLKAAIDEIRIGNEAFRGGLWSILVKVLCPLAIVAILVTNYLVPLF